MTTNVDGSPAETPEIETNSQVTDIDDPLAAIRAQCNTWLAEAFRLRQVPNPSDTAPPAAVHRALVQARAHLDTLETYLSTALAFKAVTATNARRQEEAAEDAWDAKAGETRRQMRREFEGAQERYAYWRLDTREQRKAARQARAAADIAADAAERIRLAYRGLDGLRSDLGYRLRYLQWESALER